MEENLSTRVNILESSVKFWKRLTLIPVLLLSALVFMGQTAPNNKLLDVERIVIRDAKGQIRLLLGTIDKKNDYRQGIYVNNLEGEGKFGLFILNASGAERASLTALDNGKPEYEWSNLYLVGNKGGKAYVRAERDFADVFLHSGGERSPESIEFNHRRVAATGKEKEELERVNAPITGQMTVQLGANKDQGHLSIERDRAGFGRTDTASLSQNIAGESSLMFGELKDGRLIDRMILGTVKTVNIKTGAEETNHNTLVFFDRQGHVTQQLPK